MELEQYLAVIRKWWWLMVACVLVAAGSSYWGTTRMPRIYQATATVMVGQSLDQPNPSTQDLWTSQQLAQTYAEMVRRRPIREGAAKALGLEFAPAAGNISARNVPGTQLVEISVRDTDPERARALANAIADELQETTPAGEDDAKERQAFVQTQLEDLEIKIEQTRIDIEEEQARLDAANSARAIQQYQANITALQQRLSTYQSIYASLLVTVQGGSNYIKTIEEAFTPTVPISPRVPETVLLASAIGLGLALAGAFLLEYMDDTIKTPDDVTRATDLPILGTIARIEGQDYPNKLVTQKHPLSPISEAYRVLRTNMQFASVDKPLQTIMVTSPGPTEGKSITLANLAVVLAQSGLKVVAVDSDLRRPVLHKIFNLPNHHGLSDAVLRTSLNGADLLQPTDTENLSLLASGAIPPNPAELLDSDRMLTVIEALRGQADVILFDSPPSLVVADAAILSARVDGVLLVNDAGHTRRKLAQQSVEELRRARANLLGVVLNQASMRGDRYYRYYYYYRSMDDRRVRRQRRGNGFERWTAILGRNSDGDGSPKNREKEREKRQQSKASQAARPPDQHGPMR